MRRDPLLLTVLVVLSYGLLIPWLGFGGDEWNFIYYATRGLPGIIEVFHYDGHIQSVWIYALSFRLLGFSALAWHFYALAWRVAAVLSFWLTLRNLWPENPRQVLIVSVFFVISPVLQIQITPIAFFEIWLNYTLLFASFYFTIRAVRNPGQFHIFTLLAILFKFGHVFTSEYTWFLELMRPVVIWIALPDTQTFKTKLRRTLLIWLPFLLIFLTSTIWRGFFYTPLRKSFHVQSALFANPLQTIAAWALNLVPDLTIILFTSWYNVFSADDFYLTRPLNLALLALTALVSVGVFFALRTLKAEVEQKPAWHWQAVLLSLPALLFGILPFYIAGYTLHQTNNDRLAVAVIPGAALLLTVLVEKMVSSQKTRYILLALLVGLSVTWHIRYTNEFRKAWFYQRDFFQQLLWRAPGLRPGTLIYAIHPNPPYADDPVTEFTLHDTRIALALNAFYDPAPALDNSQVFYWYQSKLPPMELLKPSTPFVIESYTARFNGSSGDSLIIFYDPSTSNCLRVIQPLDTTYPAYPASIRSLHDIVHSQPILPDVRQNELVRQQVLGDKPVQTWCYYYQRAELAAQFGQMEDIPPLWKEAESLGLYPSHGLEYIPFIRAYAYLGDWEASSSFTKNAQKTSKGMASPLCFAWREIFQNTPDTPEKESTFTQVQKMLNCAP